MPPGKRSGPERVYGSSPLLSSKPFGRLAESGNAPASKAVAYLMGSGGSTPSSSASMAVPGTLEVPIGGRQTARERAESEKDQRTPMEG